MAEIVAAMAMTHSPGLTGWFTRAPEAFAPQCRCGPVTRPVDPTSPISWPRSTVSPTATSGWLMWK